MAQDLSFRPRSGLRRVPAGLAALIFPGVLVGAAMGVDFRAVGDGSDIATAVLATFMFLVAVPTAWIFAIDFIDAGRFTVVFVGVITSFPIWFVLGTKLAQAASHWGEWISAYVKICVIWTVFWIVLAQILSSVVG